MFARSLGVDAIITSEQRPYLVELQHGFGRRGLRELYPELARSFRKEYFALRMTHGDHEAFQKYLRNVSSNKIKTYRLLARYQPNSRPCSTWDDGVAHWTQGLRSDYLLAKPPLGCCGVGIKVLERRHLLENNGFDFAGRRYLLQEYIPSKLLEISAHHHVGCIRHIMVICCREGQVTLRHWPSYWRVAPMPYESAADNDSLTANISRGAVPIKVSREDEMELTRMCEAIVSDLLKEFFGTAYEPAEIRSNFA